MYNSNIPSDRALPSSVQLIKSTILAVVIAGILLVTVVMPAEYGIDPTGIGNAIGLKRMGEIKMLLAEEAAADAAGNTQPVEALVEVVEQPPSPDPTPTSAVATQQHEVTFTLAPMEGTEVKVTMAEGAKVNYVWETDGGPANFDEHGDSQVLNISYHEYSTGAEQRSEGVLEAAFDGNHGWFWRNRTETPLSITLRINGEYTNMIRY